MRLSAHGRKNANTSRNGKAPDPACNWNLEDLYPDKRVWEEAKKRLKERLSTLETCRGRLRDAETVKSCLDSLYEMTQTAHRLMSYASMKSDENTRDAESRAMKQEMDEIMTALAAASSFIEPELLSLDLQKIRAMMRRKDFSPYRMMFRDLLRLKPHTLSVQEEKILAEAGRLSPVFHDAFSVLSYADMDYPLIRLHDGERVRLDQAAYARLRSRAHRGDRERVFQTFWRRFGRYQRTFGVQLNGHIQKNIFFSRVRNYPSTLHHALDKDHIPVRVFQRLIEQVHEALPLFHRYLRIRQRMLKVEKLTYFDLYAPVVPNLELKYTYEQACALILDALEPLGEEYTRVIKTALNGRWIDLYPKEGKRSGAYCNGSAYDVHPYILMNFNGKYQDVSTLIHELGHAMHSFLSNREQPYPLSDYSIFVAEVASTLNESLLVRALMKKADRKTRLTLLMEILDTMKGTLFRQTKFAEFEYLLYTTAEKGEALTGERITRLYAGMLRKYYGDEAVCLIPEYMNAEWSFVPHFYYNYYVYQYATSLTATLSLVDSVAEGDRQAVRHYITFLSSGGSGYPVELLRRAGVDMNSPEPFQRTMRLMTRTMDEIEDLLGKRK